MIPHLVITTVLLLVLNKADGFLYSYLKYQLREAQTHLDSDYDFIIVGSGSAGAVIANRLSEVAEWKVLLLEAGHKANFLNEIPIMAPVFQLTDYNWNYTMEKQDGFCLAMEDQICAWPRGKALGGTTILNYMIYTRGHPEDYNKWGQESPGWSYDDVLPYFLKSENCNFGEECDTQYHSSGGYLSVEHSYKSELVDLFIQAGQELGYDQVDYNSNSLIGFSRMQANLKFGRRHSVASAFLSPVTSRPNLQIITRAKVSKILINPETKQAYGVEFTKNGKEYSVNASKEVILSAGVLNSPQLLMLSGIGPQQHLTEIGVDPIIQDLPVGQQLYDHIAFMGMIYTINKQIEPAIKVFEPTSSLEWLFRGTGFWTSLGGIEALGYISTKNETLPDLEFLLTGIGTLQFDRGAFSRPELRITQQVYDEYFKPLENVGCFSIMTMLLHPQSKGSLKLRSTDPNDPPLCFGNYLSDPEGLDLQTIIAGIRFIQKLVSSDGFKTLDATLYDKPFPGCENYVFDTDNYWECAIRSIGVTLHHQITTCKMGNGDDSVVDARFRVHGVGNLRVADTSIIPLTLSAHTSAPTMMIGEKGADFIKEDHGVNVSA